MNQKELQWNDENIIKDNRKQDEIEKAKKN